MTLTDMYGLIVAFDTTRVTPVAGGRNKDLNVGNVVAKSEVTGDRDHGGGGGTGIKLECWQKVTVQSAPNKNRRQKRTTAEPTINALTKKKR